MTTYGSPLGFTTGAATGCPFSKPIFMETQEPTVFETADGEVFETSDAKIFYVKGA